VFVILFILFFPWRVNFFFLNFSFCFAIFIEYVHILSFLFGFFVQVYLSTLYMKYFLWIFRFKLGVSLDKNVLFRIQYGKILIFSLVTLLTSRSFFTNEFILFSHLTSWVDALLSTWSDFFLQPYNCWMRSFKRWQRLFLS